MLTGIVLVLCGILIAIYPTLLSLVVSMLLIFIGAFIFIVSSKTRQMKSTFKDPFLDLFFKK